MLRHVSVFKCEAVKHLQPDRLAPADPLSQASSEAVLRSLQFPLLHDVAQEFIVRCVGACEKVYRKHSETLDQLSFVMSPRDLVV